MTSIERELLPQPSPHVSAFERMGFGMFIHWGLYAQLGQGEWIMQINRIPKEEYRKLMDTFAASDFRPREIAALARRAGMNYIVLTTRHHDGFSLYDTRGLSDYDAPRSAAGRDLVAEFVDGCHSEGIVPFFYHTTLDWQHESYRNDFDAYLEYLRRSIEILCTHYGNIGGFWFDGNWDKPDADWKEDELYGTIRRLQPDAIIVNNSGLHARGAYGHPEIDSVTFEQGRPEPLDRRGQSKYVAAEMCETINGHWGYGAQDFNCKSSRELIETLAACRKVGANYLLNIGPTGTGAVDPLQAALLETVGAWIRVNGEAVYNVVPARIEGSGADFAVRGDNGKLYFFVHAFGSDGHSNVTVGGAGGKGPRTFAGVADRVKSVRWLDNGEELTFVQNAGADLFSFYATGYPYGINLVVRVAAAEVEPA